MEIKNLLKSQANEVFEAIKANGLQPSDFDWKDTSGPLSSEPVSQLVHRASGFYFIFDNANGRFYSRWSPGEERVMQGEQFSGWGSQKNKFGFWLSYLKRETGSPDLWSAISKEAGVLESAASADSANAPFNSEEKEYITQGISEIQQYLLTAHKLDPELVESRLKYLVEASDRLGRKDWLNLLLSVLVSIVIAAALPPDATRELFRFVGTVLRQIINQSLLLP